MPSLREESHSAAFKYRYDLDENFSLGAISTLRKADSYHNYVAGINGKYKFDESNSVLAQVLASDTQYPDSISNLFCYDSDNCQITPSDCSFGNCGITEQFHRSNKDKAFTDQALKLEYIHDSEYWYANAKHQQIGEGFRADLGFMPTIDIEKQDISLARKFYNDEDSFWQEAKLTGNWHIQHNESGEFIEKALTGKFTIDGPKLSEYTFAYTSAEKVGLRHNEAQLAITGNSTRFNENQFSFEFLAQPFTRVYTFASYITGDKIDYRNNRLATINELTTNVTINATDHLELDLYYIHSELDADNPDSGRQENVYTADLTELRISYQFDVHSYLKLNLVYSDVEQNPNNNPISFNSKKNKSLSTQLIYAYKLNPQTVFFIGYSDSSYQDDYLNELEREQKTFFTKNQLCLAVIACAR